MQIIVRADASPGIGIGHVRRCLTLARALREYGANVRFAIHDWGADLTPLLGEFANGALLLPSPCPAQNANPASWLPHGQAYDVQELQTALDGDRPDWIIVDHYALDAEWHDLARRELGCRILAIDDLADRPLRADLVVDPNWDRDHRAKYRDIIGDAELLGGPRYALIDPRYAIGGPREQSDDVASIGIFMGGTDPAHATIPVLQALRATGFSGEIGIVTSSLNPDIALIRAAANSDGHTVVDVDLPDLTEFFRRHDLFILAAGGTTWERMASAAPAIAVVTAENQRDIAIQLAEEGLQWGIEAGDWAALETMLPAILADAAGRLEQARRGVELVDARGADRVAAALLTLGDGPVTTRHAAHGDAAMILAWRNDPYIRSVSRDNSVIEWKAHLAWFERIVASTDHLLLIAEKNAVPVGVVRFDRLSDRRYEISLYLNPIVAGRRFGLPMIGAAQQALSREQARDLVILAETLPGNAASQRLFRSAGYTQSGDHFELQLPFHP
ncbi:MAG TPA: UDP-2,4-diacetamido-2,4,6-trideoxy-beta-L-altropyranose hydrolase [Sphingopyxis sp.]|uniref:UDP-2,4-diacetamido-2,4, 6-trideoxy-beta-L-altropyranose hydrolase n=1 Tax=Sphingopyxis sp. TaxID=1908224 RepID=UPI002C45F36C|nr:UDP-2,4-diacetamido-2,4,6-trideoxy-beta-L-altropyranose hydrolase [Sphingopyxis sp.]HWW55891.1 UDP-2,4-diacetamido-2,4,6-trideoxy-beta-L-altropyranose hydrolase [Sphingopyxis sp.]